MIGLYRILLHSPEPFYCALSNLCLQRAPAGVPCVSQHADHDGIKGLTVGKPSLSHSSLLTETQALDEPPGPRVVRPEEGREPAEAKTVEGKVQQQRAEMQPETS